MTMRETPKCLYCGRTVRVGRRAFSDYCTDRCEHDQRRADEASARSEREHMAQADEEKHP